MVSRRQIRIKVMQGVYAWYAQDVTPADVFEIMLKDFTEEVRKNEKIKGDKGDSRLIVSLFYDTIKNREEFDGFIQSKAENWELERIALLDRILMQMGICEMLNFPEIPIKVTINEYLEIAKKYSTPKSSKFINGILDSLYNEFKTGGQIQKSGRGLIEESLPKKGGRSKKRGPEDDQRQGGKEERRSGITRKPEGSKRPRTRTSEKVTRKDDTPVTPPPATPPTPPAAEDESAS